MPFFHNHDTEPSRSVSSPVEVLGDISPKKTLTEIPIPKIETEFA